MEEQERVPDKAGGEPVTFVEGTNTGTLGTENKCEVTNETSTSEKVEGGGESKNQEDAQSGNVSECDELDNAGQRKDSNRLEDNNDKLETENKNNKSDTNNTTKCIKDNEGDGKTNETSKKNNTLKEKLKSVGLDSDYWYNRLKTKLGITDSIQLGHLNSDDLHKLEPFRQDWEKRALNTLIQKKEDSTNGAQSVQNIHQEITKTLTSQENTFDDRMKSKTESLRTAVTVGDSEWLRSSQTTDLNQMLSTVQPSNANCATIQREELNNKRILEDASGGLALRGIYLNQNTDNDMEVKQTVIEICGDIKMKGPLLKQKEEFFEFKSREKRDTFTKSITTKGYKVKGSGSIGIKCFGIQIEASKTSMADTEETQIENTEETFTSREKHAFVPVKCCELKLKHVRLTTDALKDLQEIEREYRDGKDCSIIISLCGDFLRSYGSHVKIGNLHFGGIYKWIATYYSKTNSSKESKSDIVHDALDGLISLGVTGTTFSLGAGVSGSHLTSISRIDKKYSETELSNIQIKIEPDGGPPDESDFQKWKHTMTSQNSTWALIDRDQFYGIWDIVQNHKSDFKNHKVLSDILECAWSMDIFKSSLDHIESSNCVSLLEMLCKSIEKLNVITEAQKYFRDLVKTNEKLTEFLDLIANSDNILHQINNHNMNNLLRIIMAPLKQIGFPERPKLSEWIEKQIKSQEDFPSILLIEDITNIDDLVTVLLRKFLPSIRNIDGSHRHRSQQSVEQYITKDFLHACQRLLNHLQVTNNAEEFTILLSFLQKFKYDTRNGFPRLLTLVDIEEFTKESRTRLDEYKQGSKGTDIQKQATLIDFIVTNIINYKSDISDDVFNTCYEALENCLSKSVKTTIETNIKNVPYNWKQMRCDLQPLIDGTKTEIHTYSLPEFDAFSQTEKDVKSGQQRQTFSEELVAFLNELKMSDYLPNKLKLLEAIAIYSSEHDSTIESVPWLLLETIMLQNSSVFDALERHFKKSGGSNSTIRQDDDNDDDDSDDDFLNCVDTDNPKIIQVNPIDLIVAVFTCSSLPLKQALAAKMYACRLAIPVVLPHEPLVFSVDDLRSIMIATHGKPPIPAVDIPCNVLSFVRVGKPKQSKSKMINDILSEEYHNTFFNQNSPLGETMRKVGDGLIETTIILAPQKSSLETQLQYMTFVFNLRGDATEYKRQNKWLSTISTGTVVLTTIEDLSDKKMVDFVKEFQKENNTIIFVFDAIAKTKADVKIVADRLRQCCKAKPRFVVLGIQGQENKLIKIKKDLIKEIKYACGAVPNKSILQIANESIGRYVENDNLNPHEKRTAEETIKQISNDNSSFEKPLLPLQLQLLHSLSQNMKKMFKPSEYKTQGRKAEIKNKISRIRREQLEFIPNIHPFMITFLRNTLSYLNTGTEFMMFAGWIKFIFMANPIHMTSDAKQHPLKFEHLLREIGQIYEVIVEQQSMVEQNTIDIAKLLPTVAAKLLLSGMPFELLNGDIVHVPVTWVKAVLTELENIVGPKRCLILSIIGIQSSGKSTLLNTMFGLQFPVGHGRTTNGAFMQIIPVNDEHLPFGYVLIIDTEGLRAPELGDQNYLRDTEFATFIMGLADINIVNIKGEHSTEMNEVLQMVVHALLRLRLAKHKMNTKQSCVFIYQNVSCEEKNHELDKVRQNFIETLNKNTKQAADALDITDIQTFDQVIDFDNESVWYLPDLWSGTYPMVCTNTNYSLKAAEIKKVLLYEIAANGKSCFTLGQTSERIETIWSGILMEDFAFDFRNTLEVRAFTTMDRKYHELEWNVEYYMFQFVQGQKKELVKCTDKKESEECVKVLNERIREELLQQSEIAKDEFESFIDQNPLKNIMIKWRQSFILKMDASLKGVAERSEKEMHIITEEIEQTRNHNRDIKQGEEKINERVKYYANELVDKLRDTAVDEKTLLDKFNSAWLSWMTDFQTSEILKEEEICDVIKQLVLDMNLPIKRYLNLGDITYQDCKQITILEGSIEYKDIHDDIEISRYKEIIGYARKEKKDVCINQAIGFTDKVFRYIENYFCELQTKDTGFKDIYMKKLVNYVKNAISDHNEHKSNDHQFKLLPPYTALALTCVSKYCIETFTEFDAKYKQKHSPRARLEKYKDTAWNLFLDLVYSRSEDSIAATFFLKAIEESILQYLSEIIPGEVENEILKQFKHSKRTLMKTVMVDLVDKNDFHCFRGYISAPELYVQQWLFYHTNDSLFGRNEGDPRLYNQICEPKVSSILEDVRTAVIHASYEVEDKFGSLILPWLEKFQYKFHQIPVSTETFSHVKTRNVSDVPYFKQAILNHLDDIKQKIQSAIGQTTVDNILWKRVPYNCIYDRLWGCCENCPFCNEPCELAKGHLDSAVKHSCQQHRPQGIGGFSSKDSLLLTDVCNDLIQTDQKYQLHKSKGELKYRHYRTKFPEWEISPSGNTSKYWMWFFNKYKDDLAEMNGAKPPKLGQQWTVIEQKEAVESLSFLDI